MKTKRNNIIILFLTLLTVGALVSTVTAVPYTHSTGIRNQLSNQEKFIRFVTSKAFIRYQTYVENLANKTFNTTKKAMIHTTITEKIIPSMNLSIDTKDPLFPMLVAFLQAIIDGSVLLLGHNAVGFASAYIIVLLCLAIFGCIGIPAYFVIGCVVLPLEFIFNPVLIEEIIYSFGAFGLIIALIFCIPLAIVGVLLCGSFFAVFGTLEALLDTLSYLTF